MPTGRSRHKPPPTLARRLAVLTAAAPLLQGCGSDAVGGLPPFEACPPADQVLLDAGSLRDSIPALTNPALTFFGDPGVFYLSVGERVIGLVLNGIPVAIPHPILWWHEIVNLNIPGQNLSVTYSPFTGSSLVFDRREAGIEDFRVSSFLFNNNLVMEDETASLWPQMSQLAACGERDGTSLRIIPHIETTWGGWLNLHHDSQVISSATGFNRLYTLYPYGDYERLNNPETPFPVTNPDDRRPPKERVLGVPGADGGTAFPFWEMFQSAGLNLLHAANGEVDGVPVVAFWNSNVFGAIAYRAEADGQRLTFEIVDFQRRDIETGTAWNFSGQGFDGPLAGTQLEQIPDAYVAFWFAWAEFHPATRLWLSPTQQ